MTPLPARIDAVWLPIALSQDVATKPVKRIVANVPIVLWRARGQVAAFIDRCPHRNYPLSAGRITHGRLTCPYHGWAFDETGACRDVPGCLTADTSRLNAQTVRVVEKFGAIFVCLSPDAPAPDTLPPMPEGPEFDHFWWSMPPSNARVYDALDNVLDPFHTNFIHDGYIRVSHRRQRVEQTIHLHGDRLEAVYVQDTDLGWMSRALEGPRKLSRGTYFPPVAFQGQWEGPKGLTLCVTIWFVPESDTVIRPMARFSTPKSKGPAWLKEVLIRLFLFRVITQDAEALNILQANMARFGGPRFKAGPADRLSEALMQLYMGQTLSPQIKGPFEMWL